MNWNWLNPQWLLSQALCKCGMVDYCQRVEFAAHFFAGCTLALLSAVFHTFIIVSLWGAYSVLDEFVIDGWKGKDTLVDLFSKLVGPLIYGLVRYL